MSVLIKGMEMPEAGAYVCELGVIDKNTAVLTLHTPIDEPQRSYKLVPVPPHGRLIDADALYEKTAEWEAQALHMVEKTMNDEDKSEWRKWSVVLTERSAFKYDVADMPTIIEAEEGEKHETD